MKKKIILGLTGAVIGFLFLGCAGGGSANLQPKSYTTKNVSYKDYKFIKVDPVDDEKITTQKVKDYVKTHADKFGKIIRFKSDIYMKDSTTVKQDITADDNYIKGVATIKDNMPFSKAKCTITFTKPYKVIEIDKNVVLEVAKQANSITFSKDCYAQTTFGNTYLYMPYQDENKVKEQINKLPKAIVLKYKQISKAGVIKSPNPANVIYANLKRKYPKYIVADYSVFTNKKNGKKYLQLERRSLFLTEVQTIEYPKNIRDFLEENNLRLGDFIRTLRFKRLKGGGTLYIGTYVDPARTGSRVYYVAFYVYPILSDGKIHGSKEKFNQLLRDFKETINQ
jgi:neutral trehalase